LEPHRPNQGGPVNGANADPAADFILSGCAFLAFVVRGLYPWWTVAVVVLMFVQFVATSGRGGPRCDLVGKHYGAFLCAAVLLTLLLPTRGVRAGVLVALPAFTALSAGSRLLSFRRGP
jgi:phosphatidylglycerophosphate synthase